MPWRSHTSTLENKTFTIFFQERKLPLLVSYVDVDCLADVDDVTDVSDDDDGDSDDDDDDYQYDWNGCIFNALDKWQTTRASMDLELADVAQFEGRTDRRTKGRTVKPAYRDAWTHLKM